MKEYKNLIFGRNPVAEALKGSRTVEKLFIQEGASGSVGKIISLAKEKGVHIEYLSKKDMDRIAGGVHQGVACETSPYKYAELNEVLDNIEKNMAEEKGLPLLILLDNMEDPHNLGAILRTAECVGAAGVIIPKRRSAGLTEAVAKTSAGAVEYMPCIKATNLANSIDELKKKGFWVCAADMNGRSLWESDLTGKIAVVIGNEGRGVSKLIKEKCDFTVSIPMQGHIGSLNASNAAAVIMYEVLRQQRK